MISLITILWQLFDENFIPFTFLVFLHAIVHSIKIKAIMIDQSTIIKCNPVSFEVFHIQSIMFYYVQ